MKQEFIFVIDTGEYSGNFERELCAYCTGQFGECCVGELESNEFSESFPNEYKIFSEIVGERPDNHGTHRPATIWPTPGILNNGMGKHYPESEWDGNTIKWPAYQSVAIFFYEKPTHELINFMCQRACDYCAKENIEILKFRLIQEIKTENVLWESGE